MDNCLFVFSWEQICWGEGVVEGLMHIYIDDTFILPRRVLIVRKVL